MTDAGVAALIQILGSSGALGAVVLTAGLVCRTLYVQLTTVQAQRIADAQLTTAKLLELVDAQHKAQEMLVRAIDSNVDAVRELRIILEAVFAEQRGGGAERYQQPPAPRRTTRG